MTAKIIKRFYLRINSSTKNIKMEIVCSTDSNYIMPTGIMLTSLFESNRGEVVNVHLLHDHDVLNYLFKDSYLVLPIKYNVLNEYWFDLRYSLISWEFDEQILEAQAHPAIIHFTGIPKPWYKNCKHP